LPVLSVSGLQGLLTWILPKTKRCRKYFALITCVAAILVLQYRLHFTRALQLLNNDVHQVVPSLRHRCENWECIKRHTENASMFSHLNEIMTPFSPWFIADYYWGDEILKVFGPDDQISSQLHARGLKQLLNCSDVSKFAVIFVQNW